MNINKYIYLLLMLPLVLVTSCTDPEEPFIENVTEGGLVRVETKLINFVVGDGADYTVSVLVMQGASATTSEVEVLSVFETLERDNNGDLVYRNAKGKVVDATDDEASTTAVASEQVSLGTMTPASKSKTSLAELTIDFDDLRKGITINGGNISPDDTDLLIGDAWVLTFVSKTSTGDWENIAGSKIAVSTRFAGTFVAANTVYQHPVGAQPGFDGDEIVIESVDPITYHILANGPFSTGQDPDNEFYFTIDPTTLVVDIPKSYNGATQTVWGGDEVANCTNDAGLLPAANCGSSNIAIKDDVNAGAGDMIIMSHGYIRADGTRQFYYELTRK